MHPLTTFNKIMLQESEDIDRW